MTLEAGFLFVLIAGAVVLFASEKVSFDITALAVTGILMVSGILTVEEGLSGFSNQATVTIGAMFILSAGFRETGVLKALGNFFARIAAGDPDRDSSSSCCWWEAYRPSSTTPPLWPYSFRSSSACPEQLT